MRQFKLAMMRMIAWSCSAFLLGTAAVVCAQQYPVKPIRLIVGSTPGGGADFIARLIGQKITDAFGQQVLIDNRAGAGGTLAYELGMRAPADGYTLTLITPSYSINPSLYAVRFDPVTDYTPLVEIAKGPFVVLAHPSLPVKTVRDLMALAKAKPGFVSYGSSGQGAIVHLATELFVYMAGIKMTHVPYKGGAPALNDVIAGHISVNFATPQTGLPQVKAGRVKGLAVTSAMRLPAEPNIPTVAESGVPGYEVTNWQGLIGPKGMPRAVVDRINHAVAQSLKSKDMEERLEADGVMPASGSPEQFGEHIQREIDMWRSVVQRAGIRID